MEENILLTFLSDVKVFGGKVSETAYTNVEGEKVHTTNESATRYFLQNYGEISKIFILASKLIRSPIKDFQPETTHLEYFKNRMKKFIPKVEDCINDETICNYNENGDSAENLKSVAEMAKRIQNYARGKEIVLHVDLTGGMRHINMIMLDIARLLEYSDIKIEKFFYSNYNKEKNIGTVEEINNIYDLFQLISGVEEFINFGSVNALTRYYEKVEQSANLKKLTDAMKNFADAIKLCRYGKFKEAIINLHDSINDFEVTSENVQDILMARLIGKVREKYEKLIATRGEDDLKILGWCIENGYLQQALTLYTERVPEYIYENLIVMCKKDADAVKVKKDILNEGFYFLNRYLEDDKDFIIAREGFESKIHALNEKYFSALKQFMQRKNFSYEELQKKCFDGKILPTGVKFPNMEIFKIFGEINNNPKILLNFDAEELSPLKKIIDAMRSQLEKFQYGKQRLKEIYKFLNGVDLSKYFPEYEYDTRIFRLEYMLNKKIFRLKMDREIFFCVMEKYFQFKDERNHSNHARQDETGNFSTSKSLQDNLKCGLEEIERIEEFDAVEELEEFDEVETAEKIFVNHTNHASENWNAEQKAAAESYGKIIDVPFPEVPPNLTSSEIKQMVSKNLQEILKFKPSTVLCQGEFTYTFAMVRELKNLKIPVVAATSERIVEEIKEKDDSIKKISTFKFLNFRSY